MRYSQIATALQEISLVQRRFKAERVSAILTESLAEPEMLCPVVRLLLGELWPAWECREMGVGQQTLKAALAEVSDLDISSEWQKCKDIGLVAEAALQHKGQHSLFREPLEALAVYDGLRRISTLSGSDSDQRKTAILRGLFLVASPLEGKYIARTALRSMQVGIGHRILMIALSSVMHCDLDAMDRAYGLHPDLGHVASQALDHRMDGISIQPGIPARFMLFSSTQERATGAYLPRYPGLRVQVHKTRNDVRIFTSQLRDVTNALNGLVRQLGDLEEGVVLDADLIGILEASVEDGSTKARICSQAEILRYLNRRRFSRKSSVRPALLAYDLLALHGKDICGMSYQDRRARMLSALGEPKALPFSGISPAFEKLLMEDAAISDFLCQTQMAGAKALLRRDLLAFYHPGRVSVSDFLIRQEHHISALIVRLRWDRDQSECHPARYEVAMRRNGELVPVGWVRRGLSSEGRETLYRALRPLLSGEDVVGADVAPGVLLKLRILGAEKRGDDILVLGPVVEGMSFNATSEDADDLMLLQRICAR
jgi:DNA ligase-1